MFKKILAKTKNLIKGMLSNKKILLTSLAILAFIFTLVFAYYFFDRGYLISKTSQKEEVYANSSEPGNSYIYKDKVNPGSFRINYNSSVAKMELSSSEIKEGISIHPDIRGKWMFYGDKTISFTPEKDWIPNTKYSVKIVGDIFSPEVIVKQKEFTFNSPAFTSSVESSEFYEDPLNTKIKKAVATFSFTYPVDIKDLENNVSVKSYSGDKYKFTVKIDENYINKIHVMSDPIKVKKDEDFVEIKVSSVKNAYNTERTKKDSVAKIKIPSSSTFFKISSVDTSIVSNENKNNESEQILFINFSTAVDNRELADYTSFYYKNEQCYSFRDKLKKTSNLEDIAGVKKLNVENISNEPAKTHMFKYDVVDRNGCIIVKVRQGLGSKDGFMLSNDEVLTVNTANYPMEAKIAFEGSILSLKGDKKLALSSKGVDRINIQVARIDSSNINHLVSQTSGDFSHPYFRGYTFDESNISEIFQYDQNINMEHPAKLNYSSINLNNYFKSKRGIFLIKVKGKLGENGSYTYEDNRLVIITDMGIIVKDNLDNTHNVFVSSFSEGTPVGGAKVELLGKNGIAILEGYTNPVGMVDFPNYKDFKNDKEPTAYVVTNGNDVSYIPVGKGERRLDFSRFDVDGVYESVEDKKTLGNVFTDRGIYRPGETASFGIIVRDGDLVAPNKLPLKVVIRNSNGDEVANKKLWANEFGFLDYKYSIAPTAPVGTYSIYLYDESKEYSKFITSSEFKVEEFTPDNLKIKLSLAGVKSKGWYKLPELKAEVNLQNLYGNPAIGHDVRANINLNPTVFRFKEYSGYSFKDPLTSNNGSYIRSHNEELEQSKTDDNGNVNFNINLNQFERGTYNLSVNVEGFELDSGRGVFTSSSALVSPLDYVVGYKADGSLHNISKKAERSIDFIAIDNELKKIKNDKLKMEVISIKYVSSLMQMSNGTYKYQTVSKEELVKEAAFSISETGKKLALDTNNSGNYFILIKDDEDKIVSRVDYSIAGSENTSYLLDKEASLSVTLDKSEYNQGQDMSLKITAPYAGYGLITIERDKTYNYKWFKISGNSTTENIRLPYTVEGNAYINVSFIRDSASKEIFMPPLSYAVVPFAINKEKRSIKIDLDTPEIVKPGEDLVVKYSVSKPGKIIVYGVNQGILQVAKYKRPDPLSEFMKKKALRVSTYQIMDLIMPEMNLILNHKAPGGDDYDEESLAGQINPFARKQNEVVAFWSGVIDATEDVQEYRYKVPAIFNGQIKVMAIAVSEASFGSVEKDVFVRGDFALNPSGPFNVSPGDVFEVGTSVGNLVDDSGDNYEVKVSLEATQGLEIIGDKVVILKMKEKGEESVRFKVKALDNLGSTTLSFKAISTKDESKNFEIPYHIGVRPATPYLTSLQIGYEPSELKLKNFVMPMFEEYRRQEVIASTSPLVISEGLIRYLDKYPHDCSEQLISRTYPAMVMLFKYPDLIKGIDVYNLFDGTIAKLNERQKLDGGFSVWSGSYGSTNEYVSLYALDFLSQADSFDFNVPKAMLTKAKTYAKSVAGRDMQSENDTNVAYAIYLLTKSGEVTTNYLINAEKYLEENHKKTWKSTLSSTYMAASYKLLQNEEKSRALLGKYKLGKNNVEDARYINIMATHFVDDFNSLGQKPVQSLLEPLKKANFTTNSASYSLLALMAYELDLDKNIKITDKDVDYTLFAKTGVSSKDKTLEVKSPKPFFYVVSEQGFVSENVNKAKSNFVELSKEYLNDKGNVISSAKIGDEVTVKIKVKSLNRDYINDVAITDLIPGCFEIVRDSISSYNLDNKEEREDRALIYLTINKTVSEVTYKVKVIAKGDFVAPATFAEALYDSDVKGNTKSSRFKVEE